MRVEKRSEFYGGLGKPELILAAFGTAARVCKTAIDQLNEEGVDVALFRPITLYPFDDTAVRKLAEKKHVKQILVVEMNNGQMVEDIRYFTGNIKPVHFWGRQGGIVPSPEEIIQQVRALLKAK